MAASSHLSILSKSPEHSARFAAALAPHLSAGDVVLLQGDVGAGKTHFARHLIKSILVEPEDIPSPTFTLVQVYETVLGPLWHSDLYRITSIHEIEELGLNEAFDAAICLIEWPDRLGELEPENALTLCFEQSSDENERKINASWDAQKWCSKLSGWNEI